MPMHTVPMHIRKAIELDDGLGARIEAGSGTIPRNFSVEWGFGQPLAALDDYDLLTRMAQLTAARAMAYTGYEPKGSTASISANAVLSAGVHGVHRAPTSVRDQLASASRARRSEHRPMTAPPMTGRVTIDRRAAFESPAEARTVRQEAVRLYMRQLLARQEHESVVAAEQLVRRRNEVDSLTEELKRGLYREAQSRVAAWSEKRAQGVQRVQAASAALLGAQMGALRHKQERLAVWKVGQDAASKAKVTANAAAAAAAAQEYAARVEQRARLGFQEAQQRTLAGTGTAAHLARAAAAREANAEGAQRRPRQALERADSEMTSEIHSDTKFSQAASQAATRPPVQPAPQPEGESKGDSKGDRISFYKPTLNARHPRTQARAQYDAQPKA
jgi:hypothetical protein